MVASSWPQALQFVWRIENDGQPLHTDDHDSGGATNLGVTHLTWDNAAAHGLVRDVDLAHATRDELAKVLLVNFWRPSGGDVLPAGVDLAVFNMSMVAGPGRGVKILQKTLGGLVVDGSFGPHTTKAALAVDPRKLIVTLTQLDEAFFAGLADAKYFLHGWDRRAEDCFTLACKMIGASK